MEILYNRLNKDVVGIIEDYAKDRTKYNKMLKQLNSYIPSYKAWIQDDNYTGSFIKWYKNCKQNRIEKKIRCKNKLNYRTVVHK